MNVAEAAPATTASAAHYDAKAENDAEEPND